MIVCDLLSGYRIIFVAINEYRKLWTYILKTTLLLNLAKTTSSNCYPPSTWDSSVSSSLCKNIQWEGIIDSTRPLSAATSVWLRAILIWYCTVRSESLQYCVRSYNMYCFLQNRHWQVIDVNHFLSSFPSISSSVLWQISSSSKLICIVIGDYLALQLIRVNPLWPSKILQVLAAKFRMFFSINECDCPLKTNVFSSAVQLPLFTSPLQKTFQMWSWYCAF